MSITEQFLLDAMDAVTFAKDGKTIEQTLIMNQAKVFRRNGQAVPKKEIPKLFESERPVMIFGSADPDPYDLQVMRDDILVITGGHNLVFPLIDPENKRD